MLGTVNHCFVGTASIQLGSQRITKIVPFWIVDIRAAIQICHGPREKLLELGAEVMSAVTGVNDECFGLLFIWS
jgi:hypothetical protein